jgi:hypothetical protein
MDASSLWIQGPGQPLVVIWKIEFAIGGPKTMYMQL